MSSKQWLIFMKGLRRYLWLIVFILIVSCQKDKEALTLAVSSNMQYAMEELVTEFERESSVDCEIIVGSSGKLTAQIEKGAPYDLFLSADMKYPERLFDLGLTLSQPRIYAEGSLVIWTSIRGLEPTVVSMQSEKVTNIAIGNPKTAPYGRSAMQALESLDLHVELYPKMVFGESLGQTNQFVESGAAEIGFTSLSVVKQIKDRALNWSEVDSALYTPIKQGIVVLKKHNSNGEEAQSFQKFLFSDKGKEILNKFGYK